MVWSLTSSTQKSGTFVTTMPSWVAWSTGILSRPMPYLETAMQRGAASSAAIGRRFQLVRTASTSRARSTSSSGLSPTGTTSSAPTWASSSRSISTDGHA